MQFLKILFWCLLAFVAALFTYGNWTSVAIQLWSGTEALIKLPFLVFAAYLIGLVPMYIYHKVAHWRLKQRLAATERSLGEARSLPIAPPPPAYASEAEPAIVAPPETGALATDRLL
jgi:putative membrane protein